ncbi:MAG: hypothetical protein ACO3AF_02825 [Flavobacteriales bacterium]
MRSFQFLFLLCFIPAQLVAQSYIPVVHVEFESGKVQLSEKHLALLGKQNDQLYLSPKVSVEGRYDKRLGNKAMWIAEKQVESVIKWLFEEGVTENQISASTKGVSSEFGVIISALPNKPVEEVVTVERDTVVVTSQGLRLKLKAKDSHWAETIRVRPRSNDEATPILMGSDGKNLVAAAMFEVQSRPEGKAIEFYMEVGGQREWGRMEPYVWEESSGAWSKVAGYKERVGKQHFMRCSLPETGLIALMAPLKGGVRTLTLRVPADAAILSGRIWMNEPILVQEGVCSPDQREISFKLPETADLNACSLHIVGPDGAEWQHNKSHLNLDIRRRMKSNNQDLRVRLRHGEAFFPSFLSKTN